MPCNFLIEKRDIIREIKKFYNTKARRYQTGNNNYKSPAFIINAGGFTVSFIAGLSSNHF